MKPLIFLFIAGLACAFLGGCQSPEERLMSQMDREMKLQAAMMEHMQKSMQEMSDRMEAANK